MSKNDLERQERYEQINAELFDISQALHWDKKTSWISEWIGACEIKKIRDKVLLILDDYNAVMLVWDKFTDLLLDVNDGIWERCKYISNNELDKRVFRDLPVSPSINKFIGLIDENNWIDEVKIVGKVVLAAGLAVCVLYYASRLLI